MEEVKYDENFDRESNTTQNEKEEHSDTTSTKQPNTEIQNSSEVPDETPSESVNIKVEDANTTNCLALTIQEDHKLIALKNVFLRSIRMSWKVAVSTITLALLKLFS